MKNLIKSLRKQIEDTPKNYDLYSKYNGEYIDITLSFDETWGLSYFGHEKRFTSRKEAVDWIEKNGLSDLKYEK